MALDWHSSLTAFQNAELARGQEILESRLERWRVAHGLHDRRGARTVPGELGQVAETYRNDGGGAHPLRGSSKETIRRESDELIDRARRNGFFLTPNDIYAITEKGSIGDGGIEHHVCLVGEGDNAIVIRNTKDGTYGYFDGASPTQYLRRLARNNTVFPATQIHLIGVSEGKAGEAVIWTAQPFVKGKTYDTERKFNMAMSDHGWVPHNRPNSYRHRESGAVIRDASKANVLYVRDELFPIDVIVECMPEISFFEDAASRTVDLAQREGQSGGMDN